jgi:hypothetical protein
MSSDAVSLLKRNLYRTRKRKKEEMREKRETMYKKKRKRVSMIK